MTDYWELLVVFAAAMNPPAIGAVATSFGGARRPRAASVAIGWTVGVAVTLLAALGARRFLEGLELSPETFRIAAGAILVVTGARETWRGGPPLVALPERAWERGIYPLGLPLLASPAGLAATIGLAAHDAVGSGKALAAAVPMLTVGAAAALLAGDRSLGVWRAAAQLFGALAVVVGVAFVISGVRAV